jgi:hypothetical protein
MPGWVCRLVVIVLSAATLWAQADAAHWGVQADGGFFFTPRFVVEKIHTLPEVPSIDGPSFQTGLVRFNDRGAPSYAFQYSQLSADLEGSLSDQRGRASVVGDATMRGFMATKYLNFVTRTRFAAGVGLGGGVGKLEASYTRSVSSLTTTIFTETRHYDYTIPLFEIHGRVDFRVNRYVTIGPHYGIRNGLLGGGGSLRIHFLK